MINHFPDIGKMVGKFFSSSFGCVIKNEMLHFVRHNINQKDQYEFLSH